MLIIYLCLFSFFSIGQQLNTKGNTFAVIIGISDYENEGIDKLEFAHNDAKEFQNYLMSKSGGSVPASNIVLLQNNEANYTAMYQALDWLVDTCKKGDIVYFFFSGHGELESRTRKQLGFLIAYNTPAKSNFINSALRIEDLNYYADTIAAKTRANVILVTDACHSGKLSSNENNFLNIDFSQDETFNRNEVRLASCKADQLSVEDEKWGGGRGVFSYYLLKGLNGLADKSKDGKVSLEELANYLNVSLKEDMVLKEKNHIQTPVIKGENKITLSTPDKNAPEVQADNILTAPIVAPLEKEITSYIFDVMDKKGIDTVVNFSKLKNLNANEIAFAICASPSVLSEVSEEKIKELKNSLSTNPATLKRFNKKLVERISNRAQAVINLYLQGDEAEIEKRRYYNSLHGNYEVYSDMLETAIKLVDPALPIGRILLIKKYYYEGLNYRLKIPLNKNKDSLVELAIEKQKKALELEKNEANIYNELGILYQAQKKYKEAEENYKKAIDISPKWSLPWGNLTFMYALMEKTNEGLAAFRRADSLQPNVATNYSKGGINYEIRKEYLFAEECYRKSIKLNSRHYLPFERLGFVYTHTTDYALADTFFFEAEKRKLGFTFMDVDGDGVPDVLDMQLVDPPLPPCKLPKKINDNDIITLFVQGDLAILKGDTIFAEQSFRKVLALDTNNYHAYHYLALIKYRRQQWQEAELLFKLAKENHLNNEQLDEYCSKAAKFLTEKDDCFIRYYKAKSYVALEDYFLLGNVYENWQQFNDAENIYREAIAKEKYTGAYYKLWNLLEFLGRYHEAEEIIKTYNVVFSRKKGYAELCSFYNRVTNKFPNSGEWRYKAGNFYYSEAMENAEAHTGEYTIAVPDSKDINPYEMPASYVDKDVLNVQNAIYGTREILKEGNEVRSPKQEGIYHLLKADSLYKNGDILADINSKIGDLFVAKGLSYASIGFYNKAVLMRPDNANHKMKLVDNAHKNYQFTAALIQLDSLYKNKQLNFGHQVLYTKYQAHNGNFTFAHQLCQQSKNNYPKTNPVVLELQARINLCSQDYKNAIPAYETFEKYAEKKPEVYYSIARSYMGLKDQKEALNYLQKAVDAGFNYYWVLQYDPVWQGERQNDKWKSITKNIAHAPLAPSKTETK